MRVASTKLCENPGARAALARCIEATHDEAGVSAVEFALVAPLLMLLAIGALVFALALNNFVLVTNASAAGVTNLILSRGAATPYTSTVAAVGQAAPGLAQSNLTIALTVDGTACSNDTTCESALSASGGKQASVSVSYPCSLVVLNVDYAPHGCVLSQTTAGRVQ